jgi:predicted sulfurtransferase
MHGRLRVAREGLNGTMTGSYDGARAFCEELRQWQPQHFADTDFKYTDALPQGTNTHACSLCHILP